MKIFENGLIFYIDATKLLLIIFLHNLHMLNQFPKIYFQHKR